MTKYALQVDIPNLDEGAPVEIPLLGEFANVGIYELDESRLRAFLISVGKRYEDLEGLNWPQGVALMVAKKEPVSEAISTGGSVSTGSSVSTGKDTSTSETEEPATENAQERSK